MAEPIEPATREWLQWALAVLVVLALIEVSPRVGGWILLLVTAGLAIRAHQKGLV